eukprot:Hpha_TRINITY_DN10519_c0_g1::TRINITY_DN10519_c0_g1_i2::g.31183::m.31183
MPAVLPVLLAAVASVPVEELKAALQQVLDNTTRDNTIYAVQLGWRSEGVSFGLASGQYILPGATHWQDATPDDYFMYGSGTKPFTATAVLNLVERGVIGFDDPAEKHIDPAMQLEKPGITLRSLFGEQAGNITVAHILRMQSGVPDFDFAPFDQYLLNKSHSQEEHSPLEFIEYTSKQNSTLLCAPGTCVSYSSSNYVLAGYILLAHTPGAKRWQDMKIRSFFNHAQLPSLGGAKFYTNEMLDTPGFATVPGRTKGGWAKLPNTTIWKQSSTILGWTCGNMAAKAEDVAGFFWDLLGPDARILSKKTLKVMETFKPLDLGWAAGFINYGTGLMIEVQSKPSTFPPQFDHPGAYMGHGGDTYGFLSEQGLVWGLNASISVVVNQDGSAPGASASGMMCHAIKEAYRVMKTGYEIECFGG